MSQAQLLSSSASPFRFQGHSIRISQDEDALWFAARDVCAALGIGWNGTTLAAIPKAWQGLRSFRTPSGNQHLRAMNEPAVYKLAFRSNKSEADEFTNWVASEVMPSIRKTGGYEATASATPHLATKADRRPLVDLVRMWVSMAPLGYGAAFRLVNAAMGVSSVEEMTPETVQRAIGWVQARIDAIQAAPVVLPAAAPALPAIPDDLRARLKAHTRACLDFMGETCSKARMLNTEGSLLAREVYSVLEPRFATSMPGYQARERVHDSLTTFASRGVHAMEVGADNLYLTARLMEGLAAIR